MSGRTTKTFVVTRFDPDRDEAPRTQEYEVPVSDDWKVLDALNYIKDEVDPTLSHRWSCRMAVCGSCGMMVNGEPKLTCSTALSDYGDVHSTMGSWNYGFYVSSHAANQLRWLASGSNYAVVETGGTYTIQNYEGRPAGLKALKVRRGTGNDAWLWIESRQNTGLYSSTLNASRSSKPMPRSRAALGTSE